MEKWHVNASSKDKNIVLKIKKVGDSLSNKRKADDSTEVSKKAKMDNDEVLKVINQTVAQSADSYKALLEENNAKIVSALDKKLEPITREVSCLSEKYDTIQDNVSSQGKDMSELRNTVESLKVTLKAEIVGELGDKQASGILSAYKHTLAIENEKISSNLLIFGLKTENPKNSVTELLSKLSIPSEISYTITSVTKLGKDGGEKTPTLLVSFQNGFQRNEVLKFAKNLPKGISFDRDIPLGYREAYKNMKRKAYKYRKFFKCSTQIIFSGHIMQLRYRDREDSASKSYTIVEEYFPSPESMANHAKGNITKGGAVPSVSANEASLKIAKQTLLLNGIGDASMMTLDAGLKQLLNKSEFDTIQSIEVLQGTARITCKSPSHCRHIAKNYSGKSANGITLAFDTFDA